MTEFLDILLKVVGMLLIAFTTYVAVPAIKDWRTSRLNEKQREDLSFWVKTGVLWAKQWLQTSSGQQKKLEVFLFVKQKVKELNLPYSDEDIDKAIEAFYSTVKDVVDAATGDSEEDPNGGEMSVSD